MRVEIPQRDVPHWSGVAGVAALALAFGVAIAAWGTTRDGRGTANTDAPESGAPESGAPEPGAPEPGTADTDAPEPGADLEPGAAEHDEVPPPEAPAALEPSVDEGAVEAETEAPDAVALEPTPVAEAPEPVAIEATEHAEPVVDEPPAQPEAQPAPPPPPVAPGSLRVRRGRIAYLRCDVSSGRDCARDEPMEQAVWAALDGLVACPNGPRAPGHADLRLDYRGDQPPVVEWRDTYADEVQRLDRAAVLGCLADSLAATRRSIATERLLVSFRFSME